MNQICFLFLLNILMILRKNCFASAYLFGSFQHGRKVSLNQSIRPSFSIIDQFENEHGYSTIVSFPETIDLEEVYRNRKDYYAEITDEELSYLMRNNYSPRRTSVFMGGRMALKRSVSFVQFCPGNGLYNPISVLKNTFGGPILPVGLCASISHKHNLALATVKTKRVDVVETIGVDLEERSYRNAQVIQKRILTDNEQKKIQMEACRTFLTEEEDIMVRFSMKESIYKALNPILNRYIGFQEVEVFPHEDGSAIIRFLLQNNEKINDWQYSAKWKFFSSKYLITSVNIRE